MIHLKVFISSVQKELRSERIAVGSFLATDDFLRECTAPRIFEDYPQPLRPNPKAYLDLLRSYQIYLLIVGSEYGPDAGSGLSATHEEYRLAQELRLPTLVCIKGSRSTDRESKVEEFVEEIENDRHTYSRFAVAFIRRNTPKPLVVKGLKRQKAEAYPVEVLREAVVNAVAHRDYADAGAKIAVEVYSDRLLVT